MSGSIKLTKKKEKYYLCGLRPKNNGFMAVKPNYESAGYLVKKGGGKTRELSEALSVELETAYGPAYGGVGEQVYFFAYGDIFMEDMICKLYREEDAVSFLKRFPAPRKNLSKDSRSEIHAMFGGRCAYCGKEISESEMQVDHIEAYSRGGADEAENLYPACPLCNRVKSNLSIERFKADIRHRGEIHRKRKKPAMYDSDKIAILYGIDKEDREISFYFEKND